MTDLDESWGLCDRKKLAVARGALTSVQQALEVVCLMPPEIRALREEVATALEASADPQPLDVDETLRTAITLVQEAMHWRLAGEPAADILGDATWMARARTVTGSDG